MTNTDSLTDFQSLPDSIEKIINKLELTPEQLNNLDWKCRDGWEPGDPCPDCGSSFHCEFFVESEFIRTNDGTYQFEAAGDRADTLGYTCGDCNTELYIHPVLALLFD